MIRTRDFVLFVAVLLFLGVGISSTLIFSARKSSSTEPVFIDGKETTGAVVEKKELDRQSVIDRLREKIASSDLVIAPEVSVGEEETKEIDAEVGETSIASLKRCAAPDDALSIVPKWPLNQVTIASGEGARLIYTEEDIVVPVQSTGTSSKKLIETTEHITTTLLQLPLTPEKNPQSSCVPSEVIGVSTRGILLFNGDLRTYRSVSADVLIGYARDGFPIYGVYDGAVDECGGYDHPNGYRYTASNERDYVIGCFVGTPQKFTVK